MKKALIAMSGGVDSSAAAYLMQQRGWDCIVFDAPQRAITGGQAAVVYDGDIVVGGGTIV